MKKLVLLLAALIVLSALAGCDTAPGLLAEPDSSSAPSSSVPAESESVSSSPAPSEAQEPSSDTSRPIPRLIRSSPPVFEWGSDPYTPRSSSSSGYSSGRTDEYYIYEELGFQFHIPADWEFEAWEAYEYSEFMAIGPDNSFVVFMITPFADSLDSTDEAIALYADVFFMEYTKVPNSDRNIIIGGRTYTGYFLDTPDSIVTLVVTDVSSPLKPAVMILANTDADIETVLGLFESL